MTGISATPPSSGVVKTALGAESWTKWSYAADILPALRACEKEGSELVALELATGAESVFDFTPPRKMALVVGNEVSGVCPEALNLCKRRVVIPMSGRKGSLNVSHRHARFLNVTVSN